MLYGCFKCMHAVPAEVVSAAYCGIDEYFIVLLCGLFTIFIMLLCRWYEGLI